MSEDAEREALALFRKLRRPTDPSDDGKTVPAPDALAAWEEWYNQNQELTAAAAPAVAGVYGKLANQAARLALVLHCLWHPDDPARPVERERMEDAIALAEYFRVHAHRALRHFGAAPEPCVAGLPGRVLRALERADGGAGRWVSRTKLHRLLGNGVKGEELNAALAPLLAAGRVERRLAATATKSAEEWRATGTRTAERMNHHEESRAGPAGDENIHERSFVRAATAAGGPPAAAPRCFACGTTVPAGAGACPD